MTAAGTSVLPVARTTARLSGLWRNLRSLHARTGTIGVAELLVGRAAPSLLSYERAQIFEAPADYGRPHPDIEPREHERLDGELVAAFDRLTASGEPEAPAFAREAIESWLATGCRLWSFRRAGRLAAMVFVSTGSLHAVPVPLLDDERTYRAMVVLPEHRGHGLERLAAEHVAWALARRGVRRWVAPVHGFNRRYRRRLLGRGYRSLAWCHALSVLGRQRIRFVAGDATSAGLLARRGVPLGRWVQPPPDGAPFG